jgi:ferredoxin
MVSAIFWDKEMEKPIICVHCGYCAKYCPHGVLALEERREEVPDAAK